VGNSTKPALSEEGRKKAPKTKNAIKCAKKRKRKREKAEAAKQAAMASGDVPHTDDQSKRLDYAIARAVDKSKGYFYDSDDYDTEDDRQDQFAAAAAKKAKKEADKAAAQVYLDKEGRQRKLKTRERDSGVCKVSASGKSRVWTDAERTLVLEARDVIRSKYKGIPPSDKHIYTNIAHRLVAVHPSIFGPGTVLRPTGITSVDVRSMCLQHEHAENLDARGRPPALPEATITRILAVLTAVVTAKATLFSCSMLQSVALGSIVAFGYGSLITAAKYRKMGKFNCSIQWIRRITRDKGWKTVKPQGDARKVPANGPQLCHDMVCRLAYYVKMYYTTNN